MIFLQPSGVKEGAATHLGPKGELFGCLADKDGSRKCASRPRLCAVCRPSGTSANVPAGFGAVSGSPMTSTTTWSILGPIIALTRIAIAFVGWSGAQVVGHGRSYVERAPVPCNVQAATGATGEAGYSLSAAFTSSPFVSRSKTFAEKTAASRAPRLRKVSRNHTPRWFTGKR